MPATTIAMPTIIILKRTGPYNVLLPPNGLNILSLGAGMQSTALALMSCENAMYGTIYPEVPVYDAVVFCDLGSEPPWTMAQVRFIRDACRQAGIPFYILPSNLFEHVTKRFGRRRTVSIPFWSIEDGKPGRQPRNCTLDFKITRIQQFVKRNILNYKPGQHNRPEDLKAHAFHLGFSFEEQRRRRENDHPLFVNTYPLIDMGMTRADTYAYNLDRWRLDTKASACTFCPYHTNFFFWQLRHKHPASYEEAATVDECLELGQPTSLLRSQLYISKSRKRLHRLDECDCCDPEMFRYRDREIWNGF